MEKNEEITRKILAAIDESHISFVDAFSVMTDAFACLISAAMVDMNLEHNYKEQNTILTSVHNNIDYAVREYIKSYIAMQCKSGC